MLPATNVVPFQDSKPFDLDCIFGVQIGRDKSNNFALSFNGLAVKTLDNRYIVPVLEGGVGRLIDVTCLLCTGIDPCVYRLPVPRIEPGDLIVTSDSPFSVLLATEVYDDHIRGLTPERQEIIRYVPPENLFGFKYFVRVFSMFDAFGGFGPTPIGDGGFNFIPFLLCCRDSDGLKNDNLLTALLISQGFGGGWGEANFLPFLLLCCKGDSSGLDALLLSQALAGGGGRGRLNFGQRRHSPGGAAGAGSHREGGPSSGEGTSPAASPEASQRREPKK